LCLITSTHLYRFVERIFLRDADTFPARQSLRIKIAASEGAVREYRR
jgi:hypothetical protein